MPGTAVASRQNSWARIKHKYSVKDAGKLAKREQLKVQKANMMRQRKGAKGK